MRALDLELAATQRLSDLRSCCDVVRNSTCRNFHKIRSPFYVLFSLFLQRRRVEWDRKQRRGGRQVQTKQTGRMCSHKKATKTEIPHAGHGLLHADYHASNHLGCIHAKWRWFLLPAVLKTTSAAHSVAPAVDTSPLCSFSFMKQSTDVADKSAAEESAAWLVNRLHVPELYQNNLNIAQSHQCDFKNKGSYL